MFCFSFEKYKSHDEFENTSMMKLPLHVGRKEKRQKCCVTLIHPFAVLRFFLRPFIVYLSSFYRFFEDFCS